MKASQVWSVLGVVGAGAAGFVLVQQLSDEPTGATSEVTAQADEKLDCEYVVREYPHKPPASAAKDPRGPREVADEYVRKETPAGTQDRVKGDPQVEVAEARDANEKSEASAIYRDSKGAPVIRIQLENMRDLGWRIALADACSPATPKPRPTDIPKPDPQEYERTMASYSSTPQSD